MAKFWKQQLQEPPSAAAMPSVLVCFCNVHSQGFLYDVHWCDVLIYECQVFTCHFSREVEQLGFRIRWNATASPSVQMLEPNSAAQQRPLDDLTVTSHHRRCPTQVNRWIPQGGVREDDIILEVNGIETAGKDRCLDVKFGRRKQDIKTNLQVVTSWFWWSLPIRNIHTIPYQLCHQMNHMPSTFVGKPEISIPFPRLRCCAAALLEGKATGAQVVQTKGRHQGEMGGNQATPSWNITKKGKITMHWHIYISIYIYIYHISYTWRTPIVVVVADCWCCCCWWFSTSVCWCCWSLRRCW